MTVVEESSLQLKKQGRSYFGICPFHRERTPSFSVQPKKDIFSCFGCGVSGDQIDLFARLNGIENGKAISILNKRIGLPGKKLTKEQKIVASKQYEDKLMVKKFEQDCRAVFDYLCSLRDWMKAAAKKHENHENLEEMLQDTLLISYYQESDDHRRLIDELVPVLFDEIDFEQQIEVYKRAKGVEEDWKQLLTMQEPIYYEYME
ncbi:CHC2 zinc finger domain-containing protein [Neobacillus bataviensis]|uniref:CHC2 zinc finger domain-containing protein n=1 Tax=Neobacillus bataviensis TaxID=220685 RepID=UPI003F7D03B2